MSQQKLLERVLTVLNAEEIDYMVTGSIVSSLQGEPRATHDIDIIVQIHESSIPALLSAFKAPRFFLSANSIKEAIEYQSEDTILAKLRWANISGGSEKHLTDALRVYEVQYGAPDLAYLETWAAKLELGDYWNDLKKKAQPLE